MIPDNPNLLSVINNHEGGYRNPSKHIYCETLSDDVRIIQIESVSMYALRIYGKIELQLNGQGISRERRYLHTGSSSAQVKKVKPIYYSDIISRFMSDESQAKNPPLWLRI